MPATADSSNVGMYKDGRSYWPIDGVEEVLHLEDTYNDDVQTIIIGTCLLL